VKSAHLESRLLGEIEKVPVIDVHSHVPHDAPFATSLRDLLGYHYFTELAHSAGMAKALLDPETPDAEMMPALAEALRSFDNTVQYGWLMELARELFDFQHERLTRENWRELDEAIRARGNRRERVREILQKASLEKVFLTNEFDEDLAGIDGGVFVPSLRADRLVFQLTEKGVCESLARVTQSEIGSAAGLRAALEKVFGRFEAGGAVSVAISLPPQFSVFPVVEGDLDTAVGKAAQGKPLSAAETVTLHCGVLFAMTELCRQFEMPFQMMCGVRRGAYRHGVYQGCDMLQAGDTLRNLMPLLNSFPEVTFCLSVLCDGQAQELASYGWLVRNVVVSGHWWYDAMPAYMERDLAARLQSVPKTKLLGFYSDMYKLEFGLSKFNMYRRLLARVLARDFVEDGRGTEVEALEVARLLLRENAVRIFRV